MVSLERVGESSFLDAVSNLVSKRRRTTAVRIGVGDDAAVVAGFPDTVLTTDTLVEHVHFRRQWLSPLALGRRSYRVAVSDIAAMGGRARYVLLSLALPARYEAGHARALVRGLLADAEASGVALVGGNVSRAGAVALTVTVIGELEGRRPLARHGAAAGQTLFVTGTLGAAAAGIELLEAGHRRGALIAAYRTPPLRLELGRALASCGLVTAMIDVSDGLLRDLGHLCHSSKVSACIDPASLPISAALAAAAAQAETPGLSREARHGRRRAAKVTGKGVAGPKRRQGRLRHEAERYAMSGGEDYELLFTASGKGCERKLARLAATHGCAIRPIGDIRRCQGRPTLFDRAGRVLEPAGYDHFGGRAR